ncbi:MAG: hypothetical protein Kow0080_35000 [Candidatus Promineifilaceae bacterium]
MTTKRLFSALLVIALFVMAVRETLDPDMWWHLRTGEAILQHGIPRADIFSFTVTGLPWTTHEWLSQVIMWLVYRLAGLPGLMVVFAGFIALTFWLVYAVCEARPYLAGFVTLLAAVTSAIVWGARPQIFNMLLMAAFIHVVERVRRGQWSVRRLLLLPVLMVVWANLHSGYLLGVVVLGTYLVGDGVQRIWRPEDERPLTWHGLWVLAGVTAISFFAAAINPNGVSLWVYPFLTLGSPAMQAFIQEWHSPDFHQSYFWPFIAQIFLGTAAWAYSSRRPTASDLLLFLGTAFAGLVSARHIPLFAIVSVPIVSRHLAGAVGGQPWLVALQRDDVPVSPTKQGWLNTGLLVAVVLLALVWTAVKISQNEVAIAERYPVTAVNYLQGSGLAQARGYNSYNWGGYLIWRGIPVFVDGRADVYGDDFLFFYRLAFDATPRWQEPLTAYDVDYVLMERGSPLTALLTNELGWQLVYQDTLAEIYITVKD